MKAKVGFRDKQESVVVWDHQQNTNWNVPQSKKHQFDEYCSWKICKLSHWVGIDSLTDQYSFCKKFPTEAVAKAGLVEEVCPFCFLSSIPWKRLLVLFSRLDPIPNIRWNALRHTCVPFKKYFTARFLFIGFSSSLEPSESSSDPESSDSPTVAPLVCIAQRSASCAGLARLQKSRQISSRTLKLIDCQHLS